MKILNLINRILFIASLMGLTSFPAYSQDAGTVKQQTEIQFQNIVFGRDVASIGDLNNDGVKDVVAGAPEDFNNQVYVLFLDSNGTMKNHTVIAGNQSGFDVNIGAEDDFGNSVANIGDLNNDGNTDIAVGAPTADYGGFKKGGVWILFLNQDGTVKDYQQISDVSGDLGVKLNQEDEFGKSVGSLNNNNLASEKRLLIGTPERNDGDGSFFLLSLNDSGKVKSAKEISNNTPNFNISTYALGASVQGVDDLNNDGTNDIIVGDVLMKSNNMFKGGIWVLFMNEDLSIKSFQKIGEDSGNFKDSLTDGGRFGNSITLLNDINGDNIQDIAVGGFGQAYNNDSTAKRLTGKVWILFLNQDGTVKRSQVIGKGFGNFKDTLKTGDRFGRGVANIGDLNGDRVPELAVGATGHGDDQVDRGTVFILFLEGVPQSSGIREGEPVQRLNAYPNPLASAKPLRIPLSSSIKKSQSVKVTVFDMQGGQVHKADFTYRGQRKIKVDLPKLPSGTYQLYLKAGEFQGFSKIVVE